MNTNYFSVVEQTKTGLKAILTCSLAVFFSFLVAREQSSAYANYEEISICISNANNSLSSLHLPWESNSFPHELGIIEKNEQEEDSANDWKLLTALSSFENVFDVFFAENTFASVTTSVCNPTPVPLFILYHSWKSFVS